MVYKDACNAKSNQQHLGTIKSSNLCTEIVQFVSPEETAVCNLASLALPRFVASRGAPPVAAARLGPAKAASRFSPRPKQVGSLDAAGRFFDHDALAAVVAAVTRSLNRVIDVTHYPTPEARRSNQRHRPLGLGVQGLGDTFILLGMPFDSLEAQQLNRVVGRPPPPFPRSLPVPF